MSRRLHRRNMRGDSHESAIIFLLSNNSEMNINSDIPTNMPCGCSPRTNRDDVHNAVKASYGGRVSGIPRTSCCSTLVPSAETNRAAEKMGYSAEEVESVPDESNLGLGCGAPLKTAGVEAGMTVLDLGSGAGFDSFLAANIVGPAGRVIGVDMTPEMVQKAKQNVLKRAERMNGSPQPRIDFYQGLIEELPLEDGIVDVIISNCVINLSPDKESVFREAYRVLKPGGHVCVSDIVLTKALPEAIRTSLTAYMGCIAGASLVDDYVGAIKAAGFQDVKVTSKQAFDVLAGDDSIMKGIMDVVGDDTPDIEQVKKTVVSATVLAYKK
jgi:arsenite methyltransferase